MLGFNPIAGMGLCILPTISHVPPPPPTPPWSGQLDQSGRLRQEYQTGIGPTLGDILSDEEEIIYFPIDTSIQGISPSVYAVAIMPTWLEIRGYILTCRNAQGNITIDIWKKSLTDVLAGNIPRQQDSICGGDLPKVVNGAAVSTLSIPRWDTRLNQFDVLAFVVDYNDPFTTYASFTLRTVRKRILEQ